LIEDWNLGGATDFEGFGGGGVDTPGTEVL